MQKLLYLIRKYLFIAVIVALIIVAGISGIKQVPSDTVFGISLVGVLVLYIAILLRPNKNNYASNGEKWIKKYEYLKTTEETKSHKDGSFEIYYTHHFKVTCNTSDNKLHYEYEITRNGGVSGKTNTGEEYSKKIQEKYYLKDKSLFDRM